MHVATTIRAFLEREFHCSHRQRFRAVVDAVTGLVRGGKASLTSIGRHMVVPVAPKHAIKRVDRLLGSSKLRLEVRDWYRQIALLAMQGTTRPIVLLDWSDLGRGLSVLRAAVAIPGRSLPIYEEVHPSSKEGNRRVHHRFLQSLKAVTEGMQPILVADAGFRTPFFWSCGDAGFDFVIRLRGDGIVRFSDRSVHFRTLWQQASARPQCLGLGRPHDTSRGGRLLRIILGRKTKRRIRSTDGDYQRRSIEPWLLATTLQNEEAADIDAVYASRMRIEESFRDTKNLRYGWDAHRRTDDVGRATNLLLLAALAYFVVALAGLDAEEQGLAKYFQANSTQKRRVLSLIRLGEHYLHSLVARLAPVSILRSLVGTLAIPDSPAHRRYGGPPPHKLFCSDCGDHFATYGWPFAK